MNKFKQYRQLNSFSLTASSGMDENALIPMGLQMKKLLLCEPEFKELFFKLSRLEIKMSGSVIIGDGFVSQACLPITHLDLTVLFSHFGNELLNNNPALRFIKRLWKLTNLTLRMWPGYMFQE